MTLIRGHISDQKERDTVPIDVYVTISRECNFLKGRNFELRRLVDTMVVGLARGTSVSPTPDVSIRARALVEIVTRRMAGMTTFGDEYVDPVKMTLLTRWLVDELKLLGGHHD